MATPRAEDVLEAFDPLAVAWPAAALPEAAECALEGVPEDVAAGYLLQHSGAALKTAERIVQRVYATHATRVGAR